MISKLCLIVGSLISIVTAHSVHKRGVPVSQNTHVPSLNEIAKSNRVAEWSASNAVSSAVGRDYGNQLATTAQFVAQFTAPVTKEQAGNVFNTIAQSQKASRVGQALAHSSQPVHRAAQNAANSNYDQAYQAQQLGYHRGTNNPYH